MRAVSPRTQSTQASDHGPWTQVSTLEGLALGAVRAFHTHTLPVPSLWDRPGGKVTLAPQLVLAGDTNMWGTLCSPVP